MIPPYGGDRGHEIYNIFLSCLRIDWPSIALEKLRRYQWMTDKYRRQPIAIHVGHLSDLNDLINIEGSFQPHRWALEIWKDYILTL